MGSKNSKPKEYSIGLAEMKELAEKINSRDEEASREALTKFKAIHTECPEGKYYNGATGGLILCKQLNQKKAVLEGIEWLVTSGGPKVNLNIPSHEDFGPHYPLIKVIKHSPQDFIIKFLKLFQEGKNTCAPLNINVSGFANASPALTAIERDHIDDKETAEILQILFAMGASPLGTNSCSINSDKWPNGCVFLTNATLLHFCVVNDKPLSAKVCLDHGVDRNAKNDHEEHPYTALELAKVNKEPCAEIIALLEA